MIGELPARPDLVHGEARLHEVGGLGARPGGVERRMLQQPDQFGAASVRDRGHPRVHDGERRLVGYRRIGNAPFDRRQTDVFQAKTEIVADVNHRVTMAC